MPTSGLTRMLVFLGGALSGTLVEVALAAQHATEEPRGGGGNSTGNNHLGNETPQGLPLLLRPPPSVYRDQQREKDYADADVGAYQSAGLPRRSAYFQVGRRGPPRSTSYTKIDTCGRGPQQHQGCKRRQRRRGRGRIKKKKIIMCSRRSVFCDA
ncbi:uncharacterized protein LOC109726310 isoform X2 [Ananas comosus]|uniref:Uncharacterized protein LOC109726310 isoform X2 n=1 Tax=Ananas comosus TaxID=4615 RepID=A0A6P5H095_ANACO|nr:uncharacterized protein LOC109726310 isoform X2 [Ananas comosus]